MRNKYATDMDKYFEMFEDRKSERKAPKRPKNKRQKEKS